MACLRLGGTGLATVPGLCRPRIPPRFRYVSSFGGGLGGGVAARAAGPGVGRLAFGYVPPPCGADYLPRLRIVRKICETGGEGGRVLKVYCLARESGGELRQFGRVHGLGFLAGGVVLCRVTDMGKRKAQGKPAAPVSATKTAAVSPDGAAELAAVICPTCEREVPPVDRVDNTCPFCGFNL